MDKRIAEGYIRITQIFGLNQLNRLLNDPIVLTALRSLVNQERVEEALKILEQVLEKARGVPGVKATELGIKVTDAQLHQVAIFTLNFAGSKLALSQSTDSSDMESTMEIRALQPDASDIDNTQFLPLLQHIIDEHNLYFYKISTQEL